MRSIVNWGNYKTHSNRVGERNTLPSLTVPGQTLSLQQLLDRYVRGDQVAVFNPVYTEDPMFDGLEQMDEMDRRDLALGIREGIDEYRSDAAAKKAATDKSAADKAKVKPDPESVSYPAPGDTPVQGSPVPPYST